MVWKMIYKEIIMKIVGLIAEYNPFHNGHLYHIEEAKRITGADAAVVVMSGDYVQRGTPAIMPKRLRAEMALRCGAGAVFELPVCYSTGSAEYFARGAVSLLDRLGVVDSICFGSECDDLEVMQKTADLLLREPPDYQEILRRHLRQGTPFPAARQEAVTEYTGDDRAARILREPNNILGIEYLKALKKTGSSMKPYTILRRGAGYHDRELAGEFSSASAIRSLLAYSGSSLRAEQMAGAFDNTPFSRILDDLENQVPSVCLALLRDYHRVQYPIYQNDFSLLLKYKLLNKSPKSLIRYMDVSEELANRICARLNDFFNFKQFSELLKTREMTRTRIDRALLHIMLGIKKKNVQEFMDGGFHFYARLLGVRKDQSKILSEISEKGTVPLLSRLSGDNILSETGRRMLRHDILASNLYTSVVTDKYRTAFQNEYKQALIKI